MLVVEDQAPMRAALREFLQSAYPEIHVLDAADGASALALCRLHRPRLIFMDVGLPDGSGLTFTSQIKEMLPESDVIVVSQHADPVYIERAHAAGALAYVTKDRIYSELLPLAARALRDTSGRGF